MQKKSNLGGKRPGAGRPELGKENYTFRLLPETHALIEKAAKIEGLNKSEFVEQTVLKAAERVVGRNEKTKSGDASKTLQR